MQIFCRPNLFLIVYFQKLKTTIWLKTVYFYCHVCYTPEYKITTIFFYGERNTREGRRKSDIYLTIWMDNLHVKKIVFKKVKNLKKI